MDNIILGLLLLSNRTIYQLRERIDKGLHMMYSSSLGSIQAAIKKLLKMENIKKSIPSPKAGNSILLSG